MRILTHFSVIILFALTQTVNGQSLADTILIIPLGNTEFCNIKVDSKIKDVAPGYGHLHFVLDNDHVVSLAAEGYGELEIPQIIDSVHQIETGFLHTVFVYNNRHLDQFYATNSHDIVYPYRLNNIESISSGSSMYSAIKKDGTLYTWGRKGILSALKIPSKIGGVNMAAVGDAHLAIVTRQDDVVVLGDTSYGKRKTPQLKGSAIQIESGYNHSVVRDNKKRVYAWGKDQNGNVRKYKSSQKPLTIDAEGNYSLVTTKSGAIDIWGGGIDLQFKIDHIGNLVFAKLGVDYLVVGISKTEKPNLKVSTGYRELMNLSDSLSGRILSPTSQTSNHGAGNRIEGYGSNNKSMGGSNAKTEIEFKGSGNTVTVISQNMIFNHSGNKQKITFLGSNNNVTFKSANGYSNLSNDTSEIVIDLDSYAATSAPSPSSIRKFSNARVFVPGRSRSTNSRTKISYGSGGVDYDAIVEEFAGESKYYTTGIANLEDAKEKSGGDKTNDEGYLTSIDETFPGIWQAKWYFLLNKKKEAIQTLVLGAEEEFHYKCYLALYEIYFEGLHGIGKDTIKAEMYLQKYIAEVEW